MNTNFKRRSNHLHFAALIRWVVVVAFLGAAGLSYVYLKNQLHTSGTQRKALEQELHELIAQNNVFEAQISRLTSRTALQRRIDEGFIKLVPISDHALARIRDQDSARWAATDSTGNQFQTVSHDKLAKQ